MRELVACASCSFAAVTRHASGALVARHDEIRSLMVAQLHSFREPQPCEKIKSDVKSGHPHIVISNMDIAPKSSLTPDGMRHVVEMYAVG